MLVQHHREKTINAAVFFIRNTVDCQKTKLLKLLYVLDFEHYREVGRTVTGLQYQAWRLGPVAPEVDEQIDEPSEYWQQHIAVKCDPTGYQGSSPTYALEAKSEFDGGLFTRRELALLEQLAVRYRDSTATALVDLCHNTAPWSLPWKRVWEEEGRQFDEIDPRLFLEGCDDADRIRVAATEHNEMVANYR
jgi:uncharacterized phage-associated protein